MKTIRIANQTGITILEVMIAMVILSMSLLLLLNMAMVALDGNDWSNRTTAATQAMQEKMEQLRSADVLVDGSDSVAGIARTWTVTNIGSHLRRIDLQTSWHDIRNRAKTNAMTAIIETDSL